MHLFERDKRRLWLVMLELGDWDGHCLDQFRLKVIIVRFHRDCEILQLNIVEGVAAVELLSAIDGGVKE